MPWRDMAVPPDLVFYAPGCSDGVKSQNESDVDCGGSCPPCINGRTCLRAADCLSGLCMNNICKIPPSCSDGLMDGDESDVDCGGVICPPCANGRACLHGADCLSGLCMNNICKNPPSCNDGLKNGNESDVDCGGTCPPCVIGKACLINNDCQSTFCTSGVCTTSMAFTCNNAISCINACMNPQCNLGCINMINTANGKAQLNMLLTCLENVCPAKNGGVCDSMSMGYDSNKCSTCYLNAQMANGVCYTVLAACQMDK